MGSRLAKGALLGVAAAIAGGVLSLTPFGLTLEQTYGLEILFHLRGHRTPPPAAVVVAIDKESADRLNLPDDLRKWPRSLHARLTEVLAKAGAAVIAFDVFFEDAKGKDDRAFAAAMRRAKIVVLAERQQSEKLPIRDASGHTRGEVDIVRRIPPLPLFADASAALAPYPVPKFPLNVVRGWTFRRAVGEEVTPTLPVVAFQLYALPAYGDLVRLAETVFPERVGELPRSREDMVRTRGLVGMTRELKELFDGEPGARERMTAALDRSASDPTDPARRRILRSLINLYGGGICRFLNFYGPPRTIPTIPYYRALRIGAGGDDDPSAGEVAGKAVFIGSSEYRQLAQKDTFHTFFTTKDGVDLSGVEIQATVFANMVEDMPIRPLLFRFHIAGLLVWGLAVGILAFVFRPAFSIPAVAALSLLYLAGVEYRFATAGVWYPVILPLVFQGPIVLIGAVGWNYVLVSRERRNFRRAFEYYLPVDVVDGLAQNFEGLKVSNQIANGICLATDAGHYTSLSESKAPRDLADFMNRYYEAVFDPVRSHGGMVSNVIGDAMLALWLATKENPSPLTDACLAALEIDGALQGFGRVGSAGDFPTRIGLHYGEIFLGNIGAASHYEYRPVGDIVNTATRIEGLNKFLGTRILVSWEVLSRTNGFLTRDLGMFLLAGKSRPVHIHELLGRKEEATTRQRAVCAVFAEGTELFRRQSWDEASAKFRRALDIQDGDGPSLFYLTLCTRYRQNPPGDSWDSVIHMEHK